MSGFPSLARDRLHVVPTLVVVALATLAQSIGIADALDRRLQDTFLRIAPDTFPLPPRDLPDVVVVTIDPRSLRANVEWPWPRSLHAEAIGKLDAAGARAIAFDIDFSSPSTPESDEAFAERIRRSGHVVLATFSQTQTLAEGARLEIVNRPIPELEAAAAGLGSVLVPIDSDGVVRDIPGSSSIGGREIPSLARATLDIATSGALSRRTANTRSDRRPAPLDFRRSLPAIPTLAYLDLIEGRFDRDLISGRSVFIGATAAEFQDLWSTPIAPALPGVLIQAIGYRTAAAEFAGENVLSAVSPAWTFLAYLGLGLVTLPRNRQSGLSRSLLFLGTATLSLGLGWASLWTLGSKLPLAIALCLIATQYALGIERLQLRIQARADAQESSLDALARLGDASAVSNPNENTRAGTQDSLELALELLGDVVSARGVVLLRSPGSETFGDDRLEWRPPPHPDADLPVDLDAASRALRETRIIESRESQAENALAVYAPLVASTEPLGVLVVFRSDDQPLDALHRRTISTVAAQLALTAQNLQLIDRLRETFESSIAAVAGAVEARDGYTDQHCRRLAAFSSLMGARLGLPDEEIRAMELGALLHDVGKIGIPDAILNKPEMLNEEERRQMQRHPEIGAGIIAPVVGLEPTTLHCVIHHHERWDGAGYPEGLEGKEIPLVARIVSIVDVWDALSTERPYKKAYTQPEVRDRILKGRGTQFDPELVDLFFEILDTQGDEMLELVARSSGQSVVRP